jgi:hypothetical protein
MGDQGDDGRTLECPGSGRTRPRGGLKGHRGVAAPGEDAELSLLITVHHRSQEEIGGWARRRHEIRAVGMRAEAKKGLDGGPQLDTVPCRDPTELDGQGTRVIEGEIPLLRGTRVGDPDQRLLDTAGVGPEGFGLGVCGRTDGFLSVPVA